MNKILAPLAVVAALAFAPMAANAASTSPAPAAPASSTAQTPVVKTTVKKPVKHLIKKHPAVKAAKPAEAAPKK